MLVIFTSVIVSWSCPHPDTLTTDTVVWSILWHNFLLLSITLVFTRPYSMFWQFFDLWSFWVMSKSYWCDKVHLPSLSLNLLIFVPVYWCYWEEVGDHRVLFVIFGVWTLLCSYCKVTIHPEFCGCNMLCRRQYLWYFQNIPNFGEPYLSSLVHFQCV